MSNNIYPSVEKDIFYCNIIKPGDFNKFTVAVNENYNGRAFISHNTEYKLNSDGFRSDEFKKDHDGLHILFIGCSCTAGIGNDYNDVWSYQVYKEIEKNNKVSGYYNIGHNGGSILSIINQTYLYINKYGMPDIIFGLLPEMERDDKYVSEPVFLTKYLITFIYKIFEDYCIANNITLITSSWVIEDKDINFIKSIKNKLSKKMYLNNEFSFKSQIEDLKYLEENSKTFKLMKLDFIDKNIYNYVEKNKNKENLYEAKDEGRHYGSAFHYSWMVHMIDRFVK